MSDMQVIVGKWNDQPVNINLKPEATLLHGQSYIITPVYISTVNKEVSKLEDLWVINRYEI